MAKEEPEIAIIEEHMVQLTTTISDDLQYFSSKFIECGFVRFRAWKEVDSMLGVGNEFKAQKLLSIVGSHLKVNRNFDEFIQSFSAEAAYKTLAATLKASHRKLTSNRKRTHQILCERGLSSETPSIAEEDTSSYPPAKRSKQRAAVVQSTLVEVDHYPQGTMYNEKHFECRVSDQYSSTR